MKRWDAFISHASEDKDTVAIPLVAALQRAGLRVWLDQLELRVGACLQAIGGRRVKRHAFRQRDPRFTQIG